MEGDPTRIVDSSKQEAYERIGDEVPFMGTSGIASEQSKPGEFVDRDAFSSLVRRITRHPAFSFEDSGQPQEYDDERMEELYSAISKLKRRVDSEHLELDIPDRLETILAEDEQSYPFSHDYQDITARTAHGLLCGKGANCIGFSEVCCIMLSLYGYKPVPVLSRLNKRGAACHYVTCFENKDGEIEILDPERKRSCSEPEKRYSLTAYQGSLKYAVPTRDFSKVKIGGERGIGPAFDDYFSDKQDQVVEPLILLMKKLKREFDNVGMYEKETTPTRINLKANSMSAQKRRILEGTLSDALRPIYEQSLAAMSEKE